MKERRKIVVLGTGGNSIDILDTINDINLTQRSPAYECVGFLDDDRSKRGRKVCGVKVLGPLKAASEFPDCHFVNGIGSPSSFLEKRAVIDRAGLSLERFETIVHPSAAVSRMSELGLGTVLLQNVTINSNARIGNHVIILPGSVVSHDDAIGDYTCIATGVCIAGGVKVGDSCYLGARSAVIENISIGDYCLVGMGSVVLGDVPTNSVVVGSPARFLRHTIEEMDVA